VKSGNAEGRRDYPETFGLAHNGLAKAIGPVQVLLR